MAQAVTDELTTTARCMNCGHERTFPRPARPQEPVRWTCKCGRALYATLPTIPHPFQEMTPMEASKEIEGKSYADIFAEGVNDLTP